MTQSGKRVLDPSTLVRRSSELLAMELDGEVVLMSIERGNYYGLARTARRIWELLEQPRSLDDLCDHLLVEYQTTRDALEADVGKFVLQLHEEKIVDLC